MLRKNNMKYKVLVMLSILFVLSIMFFYNKTLSKDRIYQNVLNRKGYEVYEIQKPVHLTLSIEPEWIPAKEEQENKLKKELTEVKNVKIIIASVVNRGNDIYFNFDAIPFIKYKKGKFLCSSILNNDGTGTSYGSRDSFLIYDKNGNEIETGQIGYGPGAMFSFGVNIDKYDLIKKGFTLEYDGSILYGYTKD